MSEAKTNEPVKQEGDFKIKSKKKTPKNLGSVDKEIIKVNIKEPLIELPADVTKVIIPKDVLKLEDDAIQIGETKEVPVGKSPGDSTKVAEPIQESNETTEGFSAITEVERQEVKQVTSKYKKLYVMKKY